MFFSCATKRFAFRSMFCVVSLGVSLAASSTRLSAAPIARLRVTQKSASKLPFATQKFLASLPAPKQTQIQVLAKLAAQMGGARPLPVYPNNDLLIWNSLRMAQAGEDADKARPLVYDALNIAQKLLLLPQTSEKRRAMALASSAVLRVAVVMREPILACRVYEGFLLPYLEAAPTDITLDGSRYNVLRDASIFYQTANEEEHRSAALDALLPVALATDREFPARQLSADWVYIKVASRDQAEGHNSQALDNLQRVSDTDLATGLEPLIKQLMGDKTSQMKSNTFGNIAPPSAFVHQAQASATGH